MERVSDKLLVWGSDVGSNAREQASRASRLPFVSGHVAEHPEHIHGFGAVVRGVARVQQILSCSFAR